MPTDEQGDYWNSRMIANLSIDLAKDNRDKTWKKLAEMMREQGVPMWKREADHAD